jgi:energy-coupling factor transporter ATP-binding protein EcfA2
MSGLEVEVAGRVGSFEVDVDFASDGGVTALFGHSGAGKTTVVNMIGGLVRPRRGRIVVGGRTLFDHARGITHSILGCAFYGAFATKMLVLRIDGLPRYVVPICGGLLVTLLTGLWLTSSLWFFTNVGFPFSQ